MKDEIRKQLIEKAEKEYRDFSASLIPESKPLLGVRLPVLRKFAKDLVKDKEWKQEINSYAGEYADVYFEEVMLRGMIIGYGTQKEEKEIALQLLMNFIPHIDNWSVCDSFCNSFGFASANRECVWEFLQPYLWSEKEFEVRVGLILLLTHFLKYDKQGKKVSRKKVVSMMDMEKDMRRENYEQYPYLEQILEILNREYAQGYYAQMAAAWTVAEAFIAFPYETYRMLLHDCKLDTWTYNKALQKICESKNPDEKVKKVIKALRR